MGTGKGKTRCLVGEFLRGQLFMQIGAIPDLVALHKVMGYLRHRFPMKVKIERRKLNHKK